MNKTKFSVLMSVYYKENPSYLDESLDSIFNQTLKPNEVVLVEDGPLNEELDNVINKYKNKHECFKIVKLKENMGLGKALNEGLKYCQYEYVARMDSDDISIPNRFEKQISYLEQHPEIDMLGSNIAEYDEKMTTITGHRIVPENNNEILKMMKKRNPFNHMSVIYKKNRVIQVGSYIDMPYFEDYYLWCRMAVDGCSFYNIQENLLQVRAGLSMIERRGGKKYNKYILNFQKAIKNIGLINGFEYQKNIFIRYVISNIPKKIRMYFYKKILRKKEGSF